MDPETPDNVVTPVQVMLAHPQHCQREERMGAYGSHVTSQGPAFPERPPTSGFSSQPLGWKAEEKSHLLTQSEHRPHESLSDLLQVLELIPASGDAGEQLLQRWAGGSVSSQPQLRGSFLSVGD